MKTQKNDKEELIFAQEALQKFTKELKRQIHKNFKNHIRGNQISDPQKTPLKDFTLKAKTKKHKRKDGSLYTYFNAIVLHIGKHAFYHKYGVNTYRETHQVTRKTPRVVSYWKDQHQFKMKANDFIEKSFSDIKIISSLAMKISEKRGYAVLEKLLDEMIDNINQQNA